MKKRLLYLAHLLVKNHEYLYKFVLFSIVISSLVYLFPSGVQFKYTYQKGKPWNFEPIYAPFDFSIIKTEEELENEKKDLRLRAKKYYVFNDDIYKKVIDTFDIQIEQAIQKKGLLKIFEKLDAYKEAGHALLELIYEKGILYKDPVNNPLANQENDFEIVVVKNRIEEPTSLRDLANIESSAAIIEEEVKQLDISDKQLLAHILNKSIHPNLSYSDAYTQSALERELAKISPMYGLVQKGELIISTGQIISEDKFQILESLKSEYEKEDEHRLNHYYVLAGHILIVVIAIMLITIFLLLFRKDIFEHNPQLTFILLLILFTAILLKIAIEVEGGLYIYVAPIGLLPLLIKVFYDSRLSFFVHISSMLIFAFWVPNSLEFLFTQITVGIIAIFSLVNVKKRLQLFATIGLVFLSYCIVYSAISISFEGSYAMIQASMFGKFAINSILLLTAYPLIYGAEKLFGMVSDVTLMELSDTNHPLLRQLAIKAPGTFQHAMQVANLAESAIYKIGGNPLLVKVGALFHDIGKTEMPLYFIENQITGVNPHDELSFEDSAQIIISHVGKGIEMAKMQNLPDPIIDFIRTHHGTSKVQYFYRSFIKSYPDEKVDEGKFCYPGPCPFTKETAVLMMADSVEASSRSLTNYNYESISNLVTTIIDNQIEQEQFSNANITFKDITVLKKLFIKELLSIYHVRVEYPK